MCKSSENTQTGGGKYSELSNKVESLMNEISEVKGSAIIMISIGDPEKEDGHNATTAMVGKRGDLMEMVAHVAAHPEGKDIVSVITDGLMIGLIMKGGSKDK
jgi:hypothetical protein